jgi:hypothetical protein
MCSRFRDPLANAFREYDKLINPPLRLRGQIFGMRQPASPSPERVWQHQRLAVKLRRGQIGACIRKAY